MDLSSSFVWSSRRFSDGLTAMFVTFFAVFVCIGVGGAVVFVFDGDRDFFSVS